MKKPNYKEVILTIVVGFLVFYFIFEVKWLLYAATTVGVLGLFSDFVAEKITWFWLKLAHVLGTVNSTILLSLIFFIFLTPVAFLRRIFQGKDNLRLKKTTGSVYEERNHTYVKKDLENTW